MSAPTCLFRGRGPSQVAGTPVGLMGLIGANVRRVCEPLIGEEVRLSVPPLPRIPVAQFQVVAADEPSPAIESLGGFRLWPHGEAARFAVGRGRFARVWVGLMASLPPS